MSELDTILTDIRREDDPNRKNLRVAEVVSRCFREIGCAPVVVGGSAVEFYSDDLIAADRQELLRVADSPDYRVGAELRALLAEVDGKEGDGS